MSERDTATISVEVKTYRRNRGVVSWHERDERITVANVGREVRILANRQGLFGLARELLTLAQDEVPDGSDVYLMSKGQAPVLSLDSPPLRLVRLESIQQ